MQLVPPLAERRSLGGFYLASFLAEAMHLAMPFHVLLTARYLGPAQVALMIGIERGIALALEIPSGAWADRFGRKKCVVASHWLAAIGWLLIPPATLLPPPAMLLLFALSAAIEGLSAALESGAAESWVVDNLHAERQGRLTLTYFSRERSLSSAGGIAADLVVLGLAAVTDLRLFWIASAIGEVLAAMVLLRVPEHPIEEEETASTPADPSGRSELLEDEDEDEDEDWDDEDDEDDGYEDDENEGDEDEETAPPTAANEEEDDDEDEAQPESWREAIDILKQGLAVIRANPRLAGFTWMSAWLAFTMVSWPEAFQVAFQQGNLPERGFAAVELGVDLLGVVAPLLAVRAAAAFGPRRLLALTIIAPAVLALLLWVSSPLPILIGLYLFAVTVDDLFDPVADDYQHSLIPSKTRAVTSSAISLLTSLAALGAAGVLGALLLAFPAHRAVAVIGIMALPAVIGLWAGARRERASS